MYYVVTQFILGFRAEYDGILIEPCIPDVWNGYEMTRVYRGKVCRLAVKGNKGSVRQLQVNGHIIDGNFIPYSLIERMDMVEIVAELSE